jgi:hypothetical protein
MNYAISADTTQLHPNLIERDLLNSNANYAGYMYLKLPPSEIKVHPVEP